MMSAAQNLFQAVSRSFTNDNNNNNDNSSNDDNNGEDNDIIMTTSNEEEDEEHPYLSLYDSLLLKGYGTSSNEDEDDDEENENINNNDDDDDDDDSNNNHNNLALLDDIGDTITTDQKKIKIGSRVGIYWKDDKCYYPCTIIEKRYINLNNNVNITEEHFVQYDDGESEWTNLSTEKLRWLLDEGAADEGEDDDDDDDDEGEYDDDDDDDYDDYDDTSKSQRSKKYDDDDNANIVEDYSDHEIKIKIDKEWISIRSEIRTSVSRVSKNKNKRSSGNNNDNDDNDNDNYDDDDDDDDNDDDNVQGRKTQPKGYKKTSVGNFEAQIKFKGKTRNIGTFKYERDAALAYKIATRKVQVQPILQRSDKEWKLIRSEVKAIIENENTVDNCIDDNSDDYADDDDNNEGVLGRRQPKGYRKTPSGTFEAMLRFKGKKRNIGTFKDERDAALAFKVAKRKVEALQQQLLPSSSSSSNNNNNNNNNNNRSREMRSFNPTLTMILNNNSNDNHNTVTTNNEENGSSLTTTTTTTSGSSSDLSSGGNAVVNHKKRKSTIDDDKDCDYGKDCDCDKHRASISFTTLPEEGIDTDGPDGQSSKRTLICREIAREVVGQSPYERRISDMIKTGVDQTTASHLSLYGMVLPPQTQTQTLYGETITTMATSITDPSGNNSLPSAPQQQQQQQKSSRHRY